MKGLLLGFALENLFAVECELAVGVGVSVSISSRKVGSVEYIDTEVALVVQALRRIELHLDR